MLHLEIKGSKRLGRELDLLKLPAGKRRTVMRSLGRMIRANARDRIKHQTTLDGSSMQARSSKSKGKGLMLKGLGKRMLVKTDADSAVISWRGGVVALRQQEGYSESLTAADMRKQEGEPNLAPSAAATRQQARKLRELGYKIRHGKGWKQPSLKWIVANLKMGQAGRLIHILSRETPKESWDMKLPARPFLGVTEREQAELMEVIAQACLRG